MARMMTALIKQEDVSDGVRRTWHLNVDLLCTRATRECHNQPPIATSDTRKKLPCILSRVPLQSKGSQERLYFLLKPQQKAAGVAAVLPVSVYDASSMSPFC